MAAAAAPRLQTPKEEAPRSLPVSTAPRKASPSSRPSNPARSSLVAVGPTSSGVVDLASGRFEPSQAIADEIKASKGKGLDVRVAAKGIAQEGKIKVRQNNKEKYVSMAGGSMPLLNPWTHKLGGMFLNFDIENSGVKNGLACIKERGGNRNDWLKELKNNSTALGGLGLKINDLLKPVNKFENGVLALGVADMKVGVGNYLDATFSLTLENLNAPKIIGTAEINIGGAEKNKLTLESNGDKLSGSVSLATTYKSFSGSIKVSYLADGSIDIAGKAAYSGDKLSGEIAFVATDEATANKFAKDAIAAAGGKENVQNAGAPAPVPAAKPSNKKRSLAATGLLNFNLTKWFAGTVNVVVDGKGMITVIGKIAPPGEIILFKQRDWDKQLIKFEAKAYYGIPVVGNLNLFANISLNAIAKLGPAKLYNIEILGTYSTDPEVQKNIQISGSINISAYAGLRLRAEGGAGIEILDHDLKFGVGLQADIGVKAYADARPTIGYRDPGEFYISGTLEMVAQPMLGLGGDFFIAIETPWWSPLSDDRWTWPLFSKEWPLTDPIGLSATVKDYVLGSGAVPEIEFKKPEFDPSKFMTNMVDDNLPNKSGKGGDGKGAFKEDGSVKKPVIEPQKNKAKPQPTTKGGKKGGGAKGGTSGKPNADAAKGAANSKQLQVAAKKLDALKGKGPFARGDLDKELAVIRAQVSGVSLDVQAKGTKWLVTPKAGGKVAKGKPKPTGVEIGAKDGVVAKAELGWWKKRRAFKLTDGSLHNLYFRGTGPGAQLVMASAEKPISQHLADVVAWSEADEETKARANKAKDYAVRVLEPVSKSSATPTKAQQAAAKALDGNLADFSGMLRVIVSPSSGKMPNAEYIFAGPARATAEKVSNRTSRGGEESRSGDPVGWKLITEYGLTERNGNWVRMHMISAAYGGLDVNPNLVPAPNAVNTTANRELEQQVERKIYGARRAKDVKKAPALLVGLIKNTSLLWLETTTGGFHSADSKKTPAIPANSFVKSITLRFGKYDKKGMGWQRNATEEGSFTKKIPLPDFSGEYVPSINEAGAPTIEKVTKITDYFAREVVRIRGLEGAFTGKKDFRDKMNNSRIGAIPRDSFFAAAVNAVAKAITDGKLKF